MNNVEKLKFIDELLENDEKLDDFILSMENLNCDIPHDLDKKIIRSINKKNIYYLDILKIVACTIFALLFWQFIIINPKVQANTVKDKGEYKNKIQVMQYVNIYIEKVKNLKGEK